VKSKLMKKRALVALTAAAVVAIFQTDFQPSKAYAQASQATIYVAVSGNDQTGNGSQVNPYATLARAQTAVRAINANMTGDIIVSVGSGKYYLTSPIMLDERDSGTNGYRVIWQGGNGSNPSDVSAELIGGQKVTGSGYNWVPTTQADSTTYDLPSSVVGLVYKLQLNTGDYVYRDISNHDYMSDPAYPNGYYGHQGFNTLYVNGKAAILARSQNYVEQKGFATQRGDYWYSAGIAGTTSMSSIVAYQAGGGASGPSASDIAGMQHAQQRGDTVIAQVVVWDAGTDDWMSNTLPISTIDTSARWLKAPPSPTTSLYPYNYTIPGISTPLPTQGGPALFRTHYLISGAERYFLQDNLAFLDTPGEYFYNNSTGVLYYYPKPGEEVLANQDIVVPKTQEIFHLQGTDKPDLKNYRDVPNLAKQVSNVVISNFTMEDTESADWYTTGWNAFEGNNDGNWRFYPPEAMVPGTTIPDASEWRERVQFRHGAVVMTNTNHVTVQNSYIKNIGQNGVVLDRDNTYNTVQNSVIEDVGLNGVHSDGGYQGVGAYNNNHTIYNMYIHNVGHFGGAIGSVHLWNTGKSLFSHAILDGSPRRTLAVEGGYQRTGWAATYNPLTQLYNVGNTFQYIFSTHGEQDSAEDTPIFFDNLIRGDQVSSVLGSTTNPDPAKVIDPTTGQPYGPQKYNTLNQIVTDLGGVVSSSIDKCTVHGMDFAMGTTGSIFSNIKGTNEQNFNLSLYSNSYANGTEYHSVTNTNNNFPGQFANQAASFDDSQMQYDQIGTTSGFPFQSAIVSTAKFTPPASGVYFSDDFERGFLDPTKWIVEQGTPAISNNYMSESALKGHYSLELAGTGTGYLNVPPNPNGVTVSRTFGQELNKKVSVMFFDRHLPSESCNTEFGTITRSFVRADEGSAATQVAVGSYQDYDVNNGSRNYFYYKDGSTMVRTNVQNTVGWHNFLFDYSTQGTVVLSIDGTQVASLSRPSFKYVSMSGLAGNNDNYVDQVYIYGGVTASPNVATPLPIAGDIAWAATVTASSASSSGPASNAIDGNMDTEWVSNGETNPWIQLNWTVPQVINKLAFYDRSSPTDWAQGGTLTFSDGSSMSISGIPNNGSPYTIAFPNKTVSWVKFQVAGGQGSGVGLAEMVVYGQPAASLSSTATATASSSYFNGQYPPSKAIDGNASTEWASAAELNPWLQLNWTTPQNISAITFNDRANGVDWAPGGTLTFSDGSTLTVSGIPNNNSAFTVTFPSRTATWVKFQVSGGSGYNVGLAEMTVYGQPAANVSRTATATASSSYSNGLYPPSNAIDGSVSTEWASAAELNPWLQLNWGTPQNIGGLVINDRANMADWSQGGTLTFSDGSTMSITGIPNNGSSFAVTFPTKTVSWVKFQISGASGSSNNGLAEFDVYGQAAVNQSLTATATASSSYSNGLYPPSNAIDGNISTEWASSAELNPWLQLNWTTPRNIGAITFNDRANGADWAPGGTLTFSDNSTLTVSGIPNNGSAYTVTFPSRTATWVKFQVSGGSGSNVGLAEMQVYGN